MIDGSVGALLFIFNEFDALNRRQRGGVLSAVSTPFYQAVTTGH